MTVAQGPELSQEVVTTRKSRSRLATRCTVLTGNLGLGSTRAAANASVSEVVCASSIYISHGEGG